MSKLSSITIFVSLMLLLCSLSAVAQVGTTTAPKPEAVTIFGVTLTPAQAEKFKAIYATEQPKMNAIRTNAALTDADKKTQMAAIYADMKEQLIAILTPEQVAEMEKASTKPTKQEPAKIFGVTLTPAQAEKFNAIRATEQPKMNAIRENAALTEADKKTQMAAIYADMKQQLIAILTPAQVAEMDKASTKPTKQEPSKIFGVTLTPAQAEQFKAIRATAAPKMKAIRDNAALSDAAKKTQTAAIYADLKQQLLAILTPEQIATMEKTIQPTPKPETGKIFGVTLTPAQSEQVQAIRAKLDPQISAIRKNTELSEADKKTQMTAIYSDMRKQIVALFTPEQLAGMDKGSAATKPEAFVVYGVTLTPTQTEQFKAIRAKDEPQLKAIRDNAALSAADKKTQTAAIFANRKKQLIAILTPEQVAAMEQTPAPKDK